MNTSAPQKVVIAFMRDPKNFPHPCFQPEEVETDQSHVFFMGDYAYKLFKANNSYRDNTTPEARLENSHFERLVSDSLSCNLFLGNFAIVLQPDGQFNLQTAWEAHPSQVVDYVVKMCRFSPKDLLYERLFAGNLSQHEVYALGAHVAGFHTHQAPDPIPVQGNYNVFQDEFAGLIHLYATKVPCPWATAMLNWLHKVGMTAVDKTKQDLESRDNSWRVLRTDMAFGNMGIFGGQIMRLDAHVMFEGRHSNDTAMDVANMLAPLYMHGRPDLAESLLDGYQSVADDQTLEAVLPLWVARACAGCGGAWLSRLESANSPQQVARMEACGYRYLQVAKRFIIGDMTLR